MKNSKIIAIALTATMVAACAQPGGPGVSQGGSGLNKQEVGTLGGAVVGGILGSNIGSGTGRTAAIIGGTLLGAFAGSSVGKSLDDADRATAERTTYRALETAQPGQSLPWSSRNASGTVVPSNYYRNADGYYCREYTQTITVGGRTEKAYGTACRQPDGTWRVVE